MSRLLTSTLMDKIAYICCNVPMEKSKVFFKNNSMRIKEIVAQQIRQVVVKDDDCSAILSGQSGHGVRIKQELKDNLLL